MQYREGTVRVTNGSDLVHGVFRAVIPAASGTYAAGSPLSFSISGAAGIVEIWDPTLGLLSFHVTGDDQPEIGDVVAQATPTIATGTISDFAFAPDFEAAGIPDLALFLRRGLKLWAQIADVETPSRLKLATAWAGATAGPVEYVIVLGYTGVLGLPQIEPGDVDTIAIVNRAFLQIEEAIQDSLGVGIPESFTGNGGKASRVKVDETGVELFLALDREAGGTVEGPLTFEDTLEVEGLLTATGGIASETARAVGGVSQPAFQNSWANHGDTASLRYAASFWKSAEGQVYVRGCVFKASLPDDETIFTLPAGYRPARTIRLVVPDADGDFCALEIEATGAVKKISGSTSADWISLDTISFRADA